MNSFPERQGIVKICGLREPVHAVAAAEAGADMIGFIFAPTRRYVAPEVARRAIVAAKAAADGEISAVGVFANARVTEINAIAEAAGLDFVQLSGDENPEEVSGVAVPVIKALRFPPEADVETSVRLVERWRESLPGVTMLVDGYHPGHFGGTGVRADWQLTSELASTQPIMLAGGLDPDNVTAAIDAVSPIGVDVSSGVEIDGLKDSGLIRTFVRQARMAFSRKAESR